MSAVSVAPFATTQHAVVVVVVVGIVTLESNETKKEV